MNLIKLSLIFILSFFFVNNTHAAGAIIHEDFTLVKSMCDDMITLAKNGKKENFVNLADAALKLSEAQRRDNSMAIDRFRPKIRYAKKAGQSGDFDKAIILLEEAKSLMKTTEPTWDGGS